MPIFPTLLNIIIEDDIAIINIDKDTAAVMDLSKLLAKVHNKPITSANPATIPSIINNVFCTLLLIDFAFPSIIIDPESANINIPNDTAALKLFLIGKFDNKYIIPAKIATIPIITTNGAITLFLSLLDDFMISANIPISIPNAITAPANFVGFIKDNAAMHAVITPIAITIAIIVPLHSFASFVALTRPIIIKERAPTAVIPFIKPGMDIKLSTIETIAKIPIATDIARIVMPILAISVGPTSFVINARIAIIATNPNIAVYPLNN